MFALNFAYKDPRVPWYAKLLIVLLVGYAISPIDLIPDFIPVFGYLDDLVLIPLGVAVAIRMIPPNVMEEARLKAESLQTKPENWLAAIIIVSVWVLMLGWLLWLILLHSGLYRD
ncbi:YkvA family protein [Desulfosporosinus metallidurans]|uniref:DUF1232 domain-containing protein n=1 Tax=Desulfosporosinus metallidurans TaxID=1888891 RepID=A0A1Q8QZQ8_9FIRM|nr:YkvA family protein [Desulfosporosinus metallidurans]OLN32834.1 hypothetical protein DSOL_1280 [Desulfosporosinus metallidurans]